MPRTSLVLLISLAFHVNVLAQKPERPTASDIVGAGATSTTQPARSVMSPTVNDEDYFLTSAKVIVSTGSQAKSAGSQINMQLGRRPGGPGPSWTGVPIGRGGPLFDPLNTSHTTQYQLYWGRQGIDPLASGSVVQMDMNSEYQQTYHGELNLKFLRSNGLRLVLTYSPKAILETWSLSQLTLVLEFRKQQYCEFDCGEHIFWTTPGALHPRFGQVLIPFANLNLQMSDKNNILTLFADGNFKRL